jgi:FkbM family methyltransferase
MHEDKELLDIFLKITAIIKPEISIEVGGYDSVYSQNISKYDFCKNVYAYEANPYTYNNFKDLFSKKVNYINLAISDFEGKSKIGIETMRVPVQGHYSIKEKTNKTKIENYVEIDTNSLDNLHQVDNKKVALWIDCEGANREVLLGGINLIKNTEIILIETELRQIWNNQWTHNDVVNFLEENDFFVYKYKKAYVDQANAIFLRNRWKNI